jgi:hypothetical protein
LKNIEMQWLCNQCIKKFEIAIHVILGASEMCGSKDVIEVGGCIHRVPF